MGGVNDRRSRPTKPFDSQRLAKQIEEESAPAKAPDEDDIFKEWGIEPAQAPRLAAGTTPPEGVRPVVENLPARARATTVHDPLTTSLLAEVARRTKTIDIAPAAKPRDDDNVPPAKRPKRR